jgi:hypothetical protein
MVVLPLSPTGQAVLQALLRQSAWHLGPYRHVVFQREIPANLEIRAQHAFSPAC